MASASAVRNRHQVRLAAAVLLSWAAVAGLGRAQEITVQNEAGVTTKLTAAEIAALPHQQVSADDHGKTIEFEGVPLKLLLEKAGVTFGESLRGKRLATCLLVQAADGYSVVIALPVAMDNPRSNLYHQSLVFRRSKKRAKSPVPVDRGL